MPNAICTSCEIVDGAVLGGKCGAGADDRVEPERQPAGHEIGNDGDGDDQQHAGRIGKPRVTGLVSGTRGGRATTNSPTAKPSTARLIQNIAAMPINRPARNVLRRLTWPLQSSSSAADSSGTQRSSVISAGASTDIIAVATSAAIKAESLSCAISSEAR